MSDQTPIQPRLLTKDQAAAYVGMTRRGYDRQRRLGKLPDYVPGTWRIDKVALDAAIDEMSGVRAARPAEPQVDYIAEWRRKRAERKAAEAAEKEKAAGR